MKESRETNTITKIKKKNEEKSMLFHVTDSNSKEIDRFD